MKGLFPCWTSAYIFEAKRSMCPAREVLQFPQSAVGKRKPEPRYQGKKTIRQDSEPTHTHTHTHTHTQTHTTQTVTHFLTSNTKI